MVSDLQSIKMFVRQFQSAPSFSNLLTKINLRSLLPSVSNSNSDHSTNNFGDILQDNIDDLPVQSFFKCVWRLTLQCSQFHLPWRPLHAVRTDKQINSGVRRRIRIKRRKKNSLFEWISNNDRTRNNHKKIYHQKKAEWFDQNDMKY